MRIWVQALLARCPPCGAARWRCVVGYRFRDVSGGWAGDCARSPHLPMHALFGRERQVEFFQGMEDALGVRPSSGSSSS